MCPSCGSVMVPTPVEQLLKWYVGSFTGQIIPFFVTEPADLLTELIDKEEESE